MPEAIRFQGVKKLFYAFLPRQKKSMSERSEFGFFFDDILKAENSFSNETGRQATAPDRLGPSGLTSSVTLRVPPSPEGKA